MSTQGHEYMRQKSKDSMIPLALTLEQVKYLLEHATGATAISSHLVLKLTSHAINPMQDLLNLRRRHHRRRWRWLVLLRLRRLVRLRLRWLLVTRRIPKSRLPSSPSVSQRTTGWE
ncbi:hypothetical protein HanIR_Chr04g0175141 [Helianthus annuus]|nr:hypothetical protein HanIR_Chr04g0175141 [Helianthus annuus]